MNKYIDAEKLIAEIERLSSSEHPVEYDSAEKLAYNHALSEIEDLITSLQQEQPKVGLEKEVKRYIKENFTITDEIREIPEEDRMYGMDKGDMLKIARHFYKLGLNVRKA